MEKTHRFEAAGLGKAPFRCVGVERRVGPIRTESGGVTVEVGSPGQPMGCCDYCGQGIADCYVIRSADGKEFVVGCDCVAKTGDAGLKTQVDPLRREAERQKRAARAGAVRTQLEEIFADPAAIAALEALPHPRGFVDRKTGRPLTALENARWLFERSGASGQARLLRSLLALLGR